MISQSGNQYILHWNSNQLRHVPNEGIPDEHCGWAATKTDNGRLASSTSSPCCMRRSSSLPKSRTPSLQKRVCIDWRYETTSWNSWVLHIYQLNVRKGKAPTSRRKFRNIFRGLLECVCRIAVFISFCFHQQLHHGFIAYLLGNLNGASSFHTHHLIHVTQIPWVVQISKAMALQKCIHEFLAHWDLCHWYHFKSQYKDQTCRDLEPRLENNITNWTTILRELFWNQASLLFTRFSKCGHPIGQSMGQSRLRKFLGVNHIHPLWTFPERHLILRSPFGPFFLRPRCPLWWSGNKQSASCWDLYGTARHPGLQHVVDHVHDVPFQVMAETQFGNIPGFV